MRGFTFFYTMFTHPHIPSFIHSYVFLRRDTAGESFIHLSISVIFMFRSEFALSMSFGPETQISNVHKNNLSPDFTFLHTFIGTFHIKSKDVATSSPKEF